MMNEEARIVESIGSVSVMAVASNYLVVALHDMIIWLICMFAVILRPIRWGDTLAIYGCKSESI
nr:hypothetical protein [Bacteroides coprosuis]